jgi:hypothetical protein
MLAINRILLVALAALTVLAASPATAPAQEYLGADLQPTEAEPLASGWAEWTLDWDIRWHPIIILDVQVQDIYSTSTVQVLIHRPGTESCALVGVIYLTDGSGHLTRRNWYVIPGDQILIVDESTGTLLLWGIFE